MRIILTYVAITVLPVLLIASPTATASNSQDSSEIPIIVFFAPQDISQSSVILTAAIATNGYETQCWFEWGKTTFYGHWTERQSVGSGPGNPTASITIYNLEPESTYHFRCYAQNVFGTVVSTDGRFTMKSQPLPSRPTIFPIDNITATSAIVRASFNSVDPDPSTCLYFVWGQNKFGPFNASSCIPFKDSHQNGSTSFQMTALIPGMRYYVTATTSNLFGSVSGNMVSFVTREDPSSQGAIIPLVLTKKGGRAQILSIGVHTMATDCLDKTFGEFEQPPAPPDGFYSRLISTKPATVQCLGLGTQTDIRQYLNEFQTDTFRIVFQANDDEYPIRVLWPNMSTLCKTAKLLLVNHEIIDMKEQNSYEISEDYMKGFKIVIEHPIVNSIAQVENRGQAGQALPSVSALYPNYPNPFNPETYITYDVHEESHVLLKIYNVIGQEIQTLVDEMQTPGQKTLRFNGKDLSNGIYLYQLQVGNYKSVKKMLLVK